MSHIPKLWTKSIKSHNIVVLKQTITQKIRPNRHLTSFSHSKFNSCIQTYPQKTPHKQAFVNIVIFYIVFMTSYQNHMRLLFLLDTKFISHEFTFIESSSNLESRKSIKISDSKWKELVHKFNRAVESKWEEKTPEK